MKIGVITDIHNNLAALNAVLARMDDCDQIICCGDILGIGPHPEQTVQRLAALPRLTAVRGNHDRYLLEGMPTQACNEESMSPGEMAMHRWEHACLSPASVSFLRALPLRAELWLDGCHIAVMHYCMDAQGRYKPISPAPDSDDLARMWAGESASVILFGHDHAPCVQRVGRQLFVNAGSLGCPGRDRSIARAGILTVEGAQATYLPLRVTYDATAVVDAIRRAAYPEHQFILPVFYGVAP